VNAPQHLLVLLVRIYRWVISPAKTVVFGPAGRCRHWPTCSEYALVALQRHGALRGGWLTLTRLARCHPWGTSGHDPVPDNHRFSVFRFPFSRHPAARVPCGQTVPASDPGPGSSRRKEALICSPWKGSLPAPAAPVHGVRRAQRTTPVSFTSFHR
jgi:putative membrane protein insertion efficiency factor